MAGTALMDGYSLVVHMACVLAQHSTALCCGPAQLWCAVGTQHQACALLCGPAQVWAAAYAEHWLHHDVHPVPDLWCGLPTAHQQCAGPQGLSVPLLLLLLLEPGGAVDPGHIGASPGFTWWCALS